jgi:ubiquinone/menaquinone biosynthesis C-methylase UbiE
MHRSSLRRAFRRHVPFWVGRALRAVYYYPGDVRDGLLRRRDPMVPSRGESAYVGDGDFTGMGRRFLEHFVTLGNLKHDDRVLDVGCGIGRMALPLTGFLSPEGQYWGFDLVAKGIDWCREHISPQFPNFHFYVAEVWSKSYNRRGSIQARDYVFPHEDESFDFVFATSVFTHMVPADVENYITNIARVLKPSGTCFATYFLLNQQTRQAPAAEDFCYPADPRGVCMAVSKVELEKAVAFDEPYIHEVYEKCGLTIEEPVRFGRWAHANGGPAYQDVIVARKARKT